MDINQMMDKQMKEKMTQSSLSQLLSQMGNVNPKLMMIVRFMEQYNDICRNKEEKNLSNSQQILLSLKSLQKENSKLRKENKNLRRQVSALIVREESIALALGACPLCWGENPECKSCQGEGVPGKFMPEQDAFNEFCLPSVQKLYLQVNAKKPKSENSDSTGASNNKNKM